MRKKKAKEISSSEEMHANQIEKNLEKNERFFSFSASRTRFRDKLTICQTQFKWFAFKDLKSELRAHRNTSAEIILLELW
jgi:hypothetical protein